MKQEMVVTKAYMKDIPFRDNIKNQLTERGSPSLSKNLEFLKTTECHYFFEEYQNKTWYGEFGMSNLFSSLRLDYPHLSYSKEKFKSILENWEKMSISEVRYGFENASDLLEVCLFGVFLRILFQEEVLLEKEKEDFFKLMESSFMRFSKKIKKNSFMKDVGIVLQVLEVLEGRESYYGFFSSDSEHDRRSLFLSRSFTRIFCNKIFIDKSIDMVDEVYFFFKKISSFHSFEDISGIISILLNGKISES